MTDSVRGISNITIKGFKSLYDETSVDIKPLTLLAGANSSGKSSVMQPLLLMKQTLESEYQPDVLRLDGPNVRYSNPNQFFHIETPSDALSVALTIDGWGTLTSAYGYSQNNLTIENSSYETGSDNAVATQNEVKVINLHRDMSHEEIEKQVPSQLEDMRIAVENISTLGKVYWAIDRFRCFLNIGMVFENGMPAIQADSFPLSLYLNTFTRYIRGSIHVPGLRDNPRRSYPVASIADGQYEGTFDNYFASILSANEHTEVALKTKFQLSQLGLIKFNTGLSTSKDPSGISISFAKRNDSRHEINIADVGLGVSQVLPVIVALLIAKPGQLVYLEQPELHLHPRAQVALAEVIAEAANRGVRVVCETHSSLLLMGIQTLIAEGKLTPDDTILHWFRHDEDGKTTVDSQVPDENGAYGDWPEDFADVSLHAQTRYIKAVEQRIMGQVD